MRSFITVYIALAAIVSSSSARSTHPGMKQVRTKHPTPKQIHDAYGPLPHDYAPVYDPEGIIPCVYNAQGWLIYAAEHGCPVKIKPPTKTKTPSGGNGGVAPNPPSGGNGDLVPSLPGGGIGGVLPSLPGGGIGGVVPSLPGGGIGGVVPSLPGGGIGGVLPSPPSGSSGHGGIGGIIGGLENGLGDILGGIGHGLGDILGGVGGAHNGGHGKHGGGHSGSGKKGSFAGCRPRHSLVGRLLGVDLLNCSQLCILSTSCGKHEQSCTVPTKGGSTLTVSALNCASINLLSASE